MAAAPHGAPPAASVGGALPDAPLTVALVAGEASGDQLGAGLVRELKRLHPGIRCVGVAGPLMVEAGCEAWWDADELAVMGLFEIVRHLPRLVRLRRALIARLLAERPAVLIGIDAPDFNLGLEQRVRAQGIPTVHYVSPTVWAWREGRIHTIRKAVDLMLCILPFEEAYYARQDLAARFVGHPLADEIPMQVDAAAARRQLQLRAQGPVLAMLPGSRAGEIERMAEPFAATLALLAARLPELRCVVPVARPRLAEPIRAALAHYGMLERTLLTEGGSRVALAAADAALVTSGTASLEAALLHRPMAVAYRASPLTLALVRTFKLIRVTHFALPNLLTETPLIPEFLQADVTPRRMGPVLLSLLGDTEAREMQCREFAKLHAILRRDASRSAALAVISLLPGHRIPHEP
jgi:lipid-A-disaccharide synthase